LEQETHLSPDFIEFAETDSGNLLPVDIHRARVRLLEPDDDLQQNTLAGATAPEHRDGFTAGDRQVNPVQDHLVTEGLVQTSQHHRRFAIRLFNALYHDVVPFSAVANS